MSQTYSPAEQEILGLLHSLHHDMKTGFEQVDQRFEQVDNKILGINAKLDRLSEDFSELREEFHAEMTVTRTLINQAFEHISDQLVRDSHFQSAHTITPRSRNKPVIL